MVDTLGKVELIRRIAERLESYLASLPQGSWTQPSRCDLWQVVDVVAHLTGGEERQAQSMERGRQGNSGHFPWDSLRRDSPQCFAGYNYLH